MDRIQEGLRHFKQGTTMEYIQGNLHRKENISRRGFIVSAAAAAVAISTAGTKLHAAETAKKFKLKSVSSLGMSFNEYKVKMPE